MASVNKVILLGNLTRDPELRVTNSGLNICKFSVATSRRFKGSDGSTKEETAFIDVDAFGKQAEVISQYFSKGKPIYVEGRLKLDQWETPNGEKRSKLGVTMEAFQFVGTKSDSAGGGSYSDSPMQKSAAGGHSDADLDEDVPF